MKRKMKTKEKWEAEKEGLEQECRMSDGGKRVRGLRGLEEKKGR